MLVNEFNRQSIYVLFFGILVSFVAGVFISIEQYIFVALVLGVFAGLILIKHPVWIVWTVLIGAFLINGALSLYYPHLAKVSWGFSILCFLLFVPVLLTLYSSNVKKHHLFSNVLVVFLLYALISSLIISPYVGDVFSAFKRYFQLYGLMLALLYLSFDLSDIKKYGYFFIGIGVLQLPEAIYQRIFLVPLREGLGNGVVPIDVVSGTFEASLTGGGSSSVMVFFLLMCCAAVVVMLRSKSIKPKLGFLLLLVFFAPLFIGQTNVVLILLPLVFMVIYSDYIIKRPALFLFIVALMAMLVVVMGWTYLNLIGSDSMSPAEKIQKVIDYNFGDVGYFDRYSLNRNTVISFWWKHHGLIDPIGTFFGHGLGSSHEGSGSASGYLSQIYGGYFIGLTTASTLLWDLGLFGFSLALAPFLLGWIKLQQMQRVSGDKIKSWCLLLKVCLLINFISIFYSNSFVMNFSHQALIAINFGMIGWLENYINDLSQKEMVKLT